LVDEKMTTTIHATVGRDENNTDLVVELANGGGHFAIQGQSRSGKSTFVYRLLGSLAHYPELAVAGIDPSSLLLNPFNGAPHRNWRHLGAVDFHEASEVLYRITAEMDLRTAELLNRDLDKLESYTTDQPLILVVMEEYPGTLAGAKSEDEVLARKPHERVAPQISRSVKRLVQEGAKVGVRVLLMAQRATAETLDGDTRSNCATRITMRVDNSAAVRLLHEDCPDELVVQCRQFEPGVGIIERPGHGITRFRADLVDYQWYLEKVHSVYPKPEFDSGFTQIDWNVFGKETRLWHRGAR